MSLGDLSEDLLQAYRDGRLSERELLRVSLVAHDSNLTLIDVGMMGGWSEYRERILRYR